MQQTYLERLMRFALTLLVIWLGMAALRGLTPGAPLDSTFSIVTERPVADIVREALRGHGASTAWAMLYALPVALLLGVPAGLRPGSLVDRVLQAPALLLMGVPSTVGLLFAVKHLALDAQWVSIPGAGSVAIALIGGGWLARAVRAGLAGARDEAGALQPGLAVVLVAGRVLQQTGNMLILTLLLGPGGFTGAAGSQTLLQSIMSRDVPVTAALAGSLLVGTAVAHLIGDLLVTTGARWGQPASRPALGLLLPGLALGSLVVVIAFLGFPDVAAIDLLQRNKPPGPGHLLGTDPFGRDLLGMLSAGARTSLAVAVGGTVLAAIGGGFLGLIGGLTGRWGGALLSPRVATPTLLAPFFAVIIAVSVVGPGLTTLMIAIGLAGMPLMAYPVRRLVAAPAGPLRDGLVWGVLGALLLLFAQSLLAEAIAGILGLSAQPPTPSIGTVLGGMRPFIRQAPHLLTAAIPVMLAFGGLIMAGHALSDAAGSEQGG